MRRILLGVTMLTISSIFTAGCDQAGDSRSSSELDARFQAVVESVVASDEKIHGASLAVVSPSSNIDWEGAAGLADPSNGTPMSPANPVRIASNTKTYTAAAVLRLVEDGRLDIDSPIGAHLPAELVGLLQSGSYDPSVITIRHLLTHTGGLDDHGSADVYTEKIIADPQHHWTPVEQITGLVEWRSKLGEPGEVYSYSDSGYVLLGVIIEETTGLKLGPAVRELIGFDALGLDSTWWEIMETLPDGVVDRAHQFLGEEDVTDFVPYFDLYGGGGIATTMGDLARFFGAIFRSEVYHDPATLEIMLSTFDGLTAAPEADEKALPPGAYRMGIWVLETEGHTTYHHTGFWGTTAIHVPDLDLTIAATANQNQCGDDFDRLIAGVIGIVAEGS